jgi:hypothetical protein
MTQVRHRYSNLYGMGKRTQATRQLDTLSNRH